MKLQQKYFLIFFSLFVTLSIAMTMTAYFLSNHILLKKYEELSADNLSYMLEITEKELDQLGSTFNFIANDLTVYDRIVTEYSDTDSYNKLTADKDVTEMFNALSSFDIFNSIDLMYIRGINDEEYWYKGGADFFDAETLIGDIDLEHLSITGLHYLGMKENRNPYTSSFTVMRFAKTLLDSLGQKIGVVYFEMDAGYFKQLYNNDRTIEGTNLYLVDEWDQLIYHENAYMVGRKFNFSDYEGIIVEDDLSGYDWKLISVSSEDSIYDESGLIIRVTLLMAAASIIVATFLIILITSRIVRPIKQLIKAMKEVKYGDLEVQVDHTGDDEIGELTDNFNSMTLQLKNNMDKEIAYTKAMNDAEYKALQAQINPHFMYNSLNALKWLAGIQKADNIIDLVDALWTLLKKTSSLKGQFVTLKSELEVIEAYSTIQQVRYKGKFEIIYEVDPKHLGIIVPKYIFQPFVENAIFHGIEPKKGPGRIIITTRDVDRDVEISVQDDGVGIEKDRISRILIDSNEQQEGAGLNNIGVKNVNERMKLLYGDTYGIIIKSEVGVGTTMSIRIPRATTLEGGEYV